MQTESIREEVRINLKLGETVGFSRFGDKV